jgi:hypothetical protein
MTNFNEEMFIDIVIAEIYQDTNEFSVNYDILHRNYSKYIGFDSELEQNIYNKYQKTFVKLTYDAFGGYYIIKVPMIDYNFINYQPSLFTILSYKMENAIDQGKLLEYAYSDAGTEKDNNEEIPQILLDFDDLGI